GRCTPSNPCPTPPSALGEKSDPGNISRWIRAERPATWLGEKGFVGGTEDPTGLTHLGAREYDATNGRFISVDPIGDLKDPQQINGYAYSNNNPVTFSDPTGLILACGSGEPACPSGPKGTPVNAVSSGATTSDAGTTNSAGTANHSQGGLDGVTCYNFSGGYALSVPCSSGEPSNPKARGGWKEVLGAIGRWLTESAEAASNASPWCWIEDCSGATDAYDEFISTKGVDTDSVHYKDTQVALDVASMASVAGLGKKLLKTLTKKNDVPTPSCKCFLAGTAVLMADGKTKSIEEIELGDKVLATDPETGEQGPREVTSLIVTKDDKRFNELSIATEAGIKKLTATHEHPFWSPSELDWVPAADLQPGMTLRTDDGATVIVTANKAFATTFSTTYNLTVDDLHTYYVVAGTTPVLVHNCNLGDYADSVRNEPGVKFASEYTSPSGAKYYGRNKHGQQAEGPLADALERTGHHGGCAEVHCLIQAQAAEGPEAIRGGTMRTVRTRNNSMPTSNTDGHGEPAHPCGRCGRLLEDLEIN
ncbi:polymorphic toxin-type HINT domain-containing protein, partial [Streptomyces sp. NPDC047706]|uniref:polymorphic toxin-type HINT domain-containing protein n=1 Tax=Streptomyces sp. NPDC047706 TaxID=3365486 RepID=UPI00370FF795